jgi:hypothetical protein
MVMRTLESSRILQGCTSCTPVGSDWTPVYVDFFVSSFDLHLLLCRFYQAVICSLYRSLRRMYASKWAGGVCVCYLNE